MTLAAPASMVERLLVLLPDPGPADRAALEAEFERARAQASAFPVESWWRCLRDFLMVHRRVPRRPATLFSEALYFVKASADILAPGRVFVSDKEWVKHWVRDAAGEEFNVPTLAVLKTADEVDGFAFPDRCVVKPTHLSGEAILRTAGEPVDLGRVASWLTTNYAPVSGELNYLPLTPQVIVEPFVFDETRVDDYKFFCVDGRVRLVQVDQDRATFHRRVLYDAGGRPLPSSIHYPRGEERPLPANFEAMKVLAGKLSAPFGFVRVDLYSDGRDVKVGELTNCHGGGLEAFGTFDEEVAVSALLFGDGAAGRDGEANPSAGAALGGLAAQSGLAEHRRRSGPGEEPALVAHLSERLEALAKPRVLWLGSPRGTGPLAARVVERGGRWVTVEDEAAALSRVWEGDEAPRGEYRLVSLITSDFLGMRPAFYDLSLLGGEDVFDIVVVAGPSDLSGPMARLLALPSLVGHLAPAFAALLCRAEGDDARKTLDIWRLLAPQLRQAAVPGVPGLVTVGSGGF